MNEQKQYKSESFAAIHEIMDALYKIKAIDNKTMQEFDAQCLNVELKKPSESGLISPSPIKPTSQRGG